MLSEALCFFAILKLTFDTEDVFDRQANPLTAHRCQPRQWHARRLDPVEAARAPMRDRNCSGREVDVSTAHRAALSYHGHDGDDDGARDADLADGLLA